MKVYYCDEFKGFYPVGTAAVVIAENKVQAKKILFAELRAIGLSGVKHDKTAITAKDLVEISLDKANVVVISDGNY